MSPAKRPFRKEPKPGEVLLVPVGDQCWGYLLTYGYYDAWLLDFYTDHPTRRPSFFSRPSWKQPLDFVPNRIPTAFLTVCKLELTEKEKQGPLTVLHRTSEEQEWREMATPWEVFGVGPAHRCVTEEEAKRMYPYIKLDAMAGELQTFIRNLLPELRRIEVPPEDRWTPPAVADEPAQADDGPVLVEVHFQCQPEDMGWEADEIAEELGADLEVNGLGGMMTMDSAGVDSEFEVVLEVEARRMKGAITQIRKTLKRLKAPPTTRIIEVADTGSIEHPIIAPPKGK